MIRASDAPGGSRSFSQLQGVFSDEAAKFANQLQAVSQRCVRPTRLCHARGSHGAGDHVVMSASPLLTTITRFGFVDSVHGFRLGSLARSLTIGAGFRLSRRECGFDRFGHSLAGAARPACMSFVAEPPRHYRSCPGPPSSSLLLMRALSKITGRPLPGCVPPPTR